MHTIKLHIQDGVYNHVMFLLKSLAPQGVEIAEDSDRPLNKTKNEYETWSQEELQQVGKLGMDSRSFVDDDEDYSKW